MYIYGKIYFDQHKLLTFNRSLHSNSIENDKNTESIFLLTHSVKYLYIATKLMNPTEVQSYSKTYFDQRKIITKNLPT